MNDVTKAAEIEDVTPEQRQKQQNFTDLSGLDPQQRLDVARCSTCGSDRSTNDQALIAELRSENERLTAALQRVDDHYALKLQASRVVVLPERYTAEYFKECGEFALGFSNIANSVLDAVALLNPSHLVVKS